MSSLSVKIRDVQADVPTPSTPAAAMSSPSILPAHMTDKEPAIFGTLLGMCAGGVGVYSSQ